MSLPTRSTSSNISSRILSSSLNVYFSILARFRCFINKFIFSHLCLFYYLFLKANFSYLPPKKNMLIKTFSLPASLTFYLQLLTQLAQWRSGFMPIHLRQSSKTFHLKYWSSTHTIQKCLAHFSTTQRNTTHPSHHRSFCSLQPLYILHPHWPCHLSYTVTLWT